MAAAKSNIQTASLERTVARYLEYYAASSSHTARAKRTDLQRFLAFLANLRGLARTEKLRVADWDHSSTQRFIEDALSRGEAPASVARRIATLKHLGRTLADQLPGFTNPMRDVKPPRLPASRPKALSTAELRRILKRADERISERDSFIRRRNRMLFLLLLETGLRADEIRLLKGSQLDDECEWLTNVRTKGRRYRNVYIPSRIRRDVRAYLRIREQELGRHYARVTKTVQQNHPLFLSGYGAAPGNPDSFRMGAKTLWRAVHEFTVKSGLHPHLLRHSFALDLLENSHDVRLVSQALGHSDVRITMRYTERTAEDVAHAIEKRRERRG